MNKKIFIDTLGCGKNEYDSQVLAEKLLNAGYEIVGNELDADIIIVNTCGFINDAKEESIEHIFNMVELKDSGRQLVVTGCLSQRYHDELVKEIPEVDLFIGVNEYDDLPEILKNLPERKQYVTNQVEDVLPYRHRIFKTGDYTEVLKIAEGCDNSCAFCAIPEIRGKFRSKKMEDVLAEAQDMADAGIKELVLIAQDTSFYGYDLYGRLALPELLHKLCRIEGIEWIRLLYVYDNRITDELIDVIAEEEKVCNYVDIPIQHISDKVLKSMRRNSTKESIIETVAKLRSRIPDIHIRTTLLVGFPGETEDDFQQLYDFVEETKFDRLGVFAFSDEEGTSAHLMANQIDEDVKQERLNMIMEKQAEINFENNESKVGKTLDVMIDEIEDKGVYTGRTVYDAPEIDNAVSFTSSNSYHKGEIVKVKISEAYEYDLVGEEE